MTTTPNEKLVASLKNAIINIKTPITVADASLKSGLSLHETKSILNFLLAEYRGHLKATSDGELLYSFPTGFSKPWAQKEYFFEVWSKIKKLGIGVLKFLTRAWITIVMVGYVVIFALILLAITFSKSSDRDDNSSHSSGLMFHALLRLVLDSLFWTFHPFSPFYIGHDHYHNQYRAKKAPFYERVNRFFFGPEVKVMDEQELSKLALQEIRAQKGRIGLLDLMKVTGLPKEKADPFMAKLMLDYDGDVKVSLSGGIIYEFPSMRKTALNELTLSPTPIWEKKEVMPPFTGNDTSSNLLIAGLNGFNLLMSIIAINNGWSIAKLKYILHMASTKIPPELYTAPMDTPIILGWLPFFFSLGLFLIPSVRLLNRGKKQQEINIKNGSRGLIKTILTKFSKAGIKEEALAKGWEEIAAIKPKDKELTQEIVKLGGECYINDQNEAVYKFNDIEEEITALKQSRSQAKDQEANIGQVIFSSNE